MNYTVLCSSFDAVDKQPNQKTKKVEKKIVKKNSKVIERGK